MDFLEKDLEEILKTTPTDKLAEAGLSFFYKSKILTQVKIGNYGVADMITYKRIENCIFIYIVELKKDTIGISAFLQAIRYARGLQRYFSTRGYEEFDGLFLEKRDTYFVSINIVLIGRKLDTGGSFCYYLPSIMPYQFKFYSYDYNFDGLKFKSENNWKLTEEGF